MALYRAFFLSLLCLLPATAWSNESLVDRLVAEVNSQPIFYSEVMDKVKNGPLVTVSAYPSKENDPQFDVALNDLINTQLLKIKAKELDIEVTEEELEEEIKKLLDRRGVSKEELNKVLAQQGVTYEKYKDDFKTQMLFNFFVGRVIRPQIKITEKDLEAYYLKTFKSDAQGIKLGLRQIFVKVDSDAVETVRVGKRELADKIVREVRAGSKFEDLVKLYSDDAGSKDQGGRLPDLELKDLSEAIKEKLQGLKENEVTDPIQMANGYYIFFVEKRSIAGSEEFLKKKQELEGRYQQEEIEKQMIRWLEEQRRRAKIRLSKERLMDSKTPSSDKAQGEKAAQPMLDEKSLPQPQPETK